MSLRPSHVRLASSLAFAASLLAVPSLALAEEPPKLEGRGQVLLSDLVGARTGGMGYLSMLTPGYFAPAMSGLVGYSHQETTNAQGQFPWHEVRNTFSVNPSIDVFAGKRLTLGVSIGYAQSDAEDAMLFPPPSGQGTPVERRAQQHSVEFAVAPRVGYMVPLGHGFSLWPRIGVAYSRARTSYETIAPTPSYGGYAIGDQWVGGADIGVVYRPIQSLYFSAGPELSVAFDHFEQQQANVAFFSNDSVNVRVAGTLSMGVVLGP